MVLGGMGGVTSTTKSSPSMIMSIHSLSLVMSLS
jgi:hypothetical protein